MNILHITTYMQGGAGRLILDLALMQKNNGYNVVIVMNDKEEIGYENYNEYIKALEREGIKYYKITSTFKRDIYLNIAAASTLSNIIKKEKIDIIHSHAATPSMISMLAINNISRKIPILQTMHGWGTNKREEHENMDISIFNMLHKVICVSNSDKKLLVSKGVEENRVDVIINGVSDLYESIKDDSIITKLKKFREDSKIIFGCIGSICERKNQKMIIEALKSIKNDNVKVIFIGEGEQIEELSQLAHKYNVDDNVIFEGYKSKAYNYIKYFDYVLLPSLSEGLPLTVLESFREGKPVIVSNIEVFQEIIKNRENGYIFDVSSLDNLISILNEAIINKDTEEYLNMSKKCISDFNTHYKIDNMYDRYITYYKSMIK